MHEYSGAIHMHSVFSDGSGTVEEIVNAANEVGLDFIILTDHNTLKAKELGYEKWYSNTLLIVGSEINDLQNNNHYLALGLNKNIGSYQVLNNGELGNIKSASEYVKEVSDKGGIGFIAHPHEKREHLKDQRAYPWTEWNVENYTGIEIWNHMSEWMEGLTESNKLQRFLHPLKSIVAPNPETLKFWDEANAKRKVTAIGSIDAHAHKQNVLGLYEVVIFPYKVLFKSIRTHILLEEPLINGDNFQINQSISNVLNALKEGRSFVVNSYLGEGKGFRFCAEYNNKVYQSGDTIKLKKNGNILFKAYVPSESVIKVIKDGNEIKSINAFHHIWDASEPGIYRVEAWKYNKGWIFSNHIRVELEQ